MSQIKKITLSNGSMVEVECLSCAIVNQTDNVLIHARENMNTHENIQEIKEAINALAKDLNVD